jgi:hypothetical protein
MEHGIEDTKTNLGGTPTTFFDCLDLTSLTPTLRKVGAWVCMGEFEILAVGILWRISCAGSGKARACHCLLPAKTTDRYAWRRDASLLVEVNVIPNLKSVTNHPRHETDAVSSHKHLNNFMSYPGLSHFPRVLMSSCPTDRRKQHLRTLVSILYSK